MRWRIAIGLAGLVLAACGGGSSSGLASKSAPQIVAAAAKALKSAKSVHVSGTIHSSGQKISLDLHIAPGKGESGTLTIGGNTVQLVSIGPDTYLKPSAGFAKQFAGSAGAIIANRWLKAHGTTGPLAPLANFASLNTLLGNALAKAKAANLKKGATSTVGGTSVIAVTDTSKQGTLFVATSGTAYPVELKAPNGGSGAIHFGSWNSPVTLTPPKGALDISSLLG